MTRWKEIITLHRLNGRRGRNKEAGNILFPVKAVVGGTKMNLTSEAV